MRETYIKYRLLLGLVMVWISAISLMQSCGNTSGNEDIQRYILIKGLFDRSGATADVGTPYSQAIIDFADDINRKGGIRGYKIQLEWEDYGYNANKAIEIYENWRNSRDWKRVVTIFGWGTEDSVTLNQKVAGDTMPYISASYAGSLSSPKDVQDKIEFPDKSQTIEIDTTGAPYNFFVGTDYSTSIRLAMNFIKDANGKRVAFFYCSPSDCSEPIPAGKIHALKRELTVAKDLKIELNHTAEQIDTAVKEYFDKTTATSDLWIWVGNTTHTAISIVQAVAKYAPQAQLIVNVWGFDETMFARCRVTTQAINPCYDRVFGLMPFAAYGELNYPGMKELVVTHNRQREFRGEDKHDTRYKNVRYVQGYVSLLVWKMAIERLIDAEREITGYNIRTELERFRNMETGGLTFPISFSATDHRPTFGTLIYSFGQEGYLEYQGQVSIELEDKWLGW